MLMAEQLMYLLITTGGLMLNQNNRVREATNKISQKPKEKEIS
jgi:hypothetical protein